MPLRFPLTREGWQFDLVGLLAIIGEASLAEISLPLTSSRLTMLPRLLPAPHALIRPDRKPTLPPNTSGTIVGAQSGNVRNQIPLFADILHPLELVTPYSVHRYNLLHTNKVEENEQPELHPRALSPLNILTVASFFLTCGLLGWAIYLEDGCAALSILFISIAGSATSSATYWRFRRPLRRASRLVPSSEVVVQAPGGAFIVVHCSETAARGVYFSDFQLVYWMSRSAYQICVSAGTVLLMFGIVLMANSQWVMQVALGASYLLLNGLYLLAALSRRTTRRLHWDLSSVRLNQRPPRGGNSYLAKFETLKAHETPLRQDVPGTRPTYQCDNFTQTMWCVIWETQSARWLRLVGLAPNTPSWDEWLKKAEEQAQSSNSEWDPENAYDEIMAKHHSKVT